jgi:hypothetical protein
LRTGRAAQRADPVSDDFGRLKLAVDQDRELVAADAGQRVGRSDAPPKPLADREQQLVAACVAEPIVDLLEVVQVDEYQHEWAATDRRVETLGEQHPVGQTRQRSWCT